MIQPGDRFGDYTVVRLLGRGGMGSVFLLSNAEGGQVAAKILDPESAGDEESRRRFLREAQLALGVEHPNLVQTYDVGEDPETGLCYILMEYVPGGSLADRIKKGPLTVNDAIRIVYQIASVLELARQKGIVHRDIKPDNIMFGADGKAKLADLGIARGGVGSVGVTTVTQTGMMIGTPAYMSPEQMLDSHNVDCRADIYSLGIVFYEMLTGKRPNHDDTVVQLMAKAVAGEPIPDVRKLRPEVSASVAELISLMCAMKADERVATPAEVTTALSQIVHGREVTIRRKRPTAIPPRRRGFPKAIVPVLILCGLAAAGAWFYVGHRPQRLTSQVAPPVAATNEAIRTLPPAVSPQPDVERPSSVRSQPPAKPKADAAATPARPRKPPLVFDLGEGEKLEFVSCPAGTFMMGLLGPHEAGYPAHRVEITRPYWISRYQLTWRQWKILTGETHAFSKVEDILGGDQSPVMYKEQRLVDALCAKLTRRFSGDIPSGYAFRVPTYAEWEYASRAGDEGGEDDYKRYRRGWGEVFHRIAWTFEDSYKALKKAGYETFPDHAAWEDACRRKWETHGILTAQEKKWLRDCEHAAAVGRKAPNHWGIYDMFGNRHEPLLDRVDSSFGRGPIRSGLSWEGLERDPLLTCGAADARPTMALEMQGVLAVRDSHCPSIRLVVGPMDFNDGKTRIELPAEKRNEPERVEGQPVNRTEERASARPRRPLLTFDVGSGEKLEFVSCPAGVFMMGMPGAQFEPNCPMHQVEISRPYWISRYQLTWRQWTSLTGKAHAFSKVENLLGGDRCPVTSRGQTEVAELCARLTRRFAGKIPSGYTFRLPTCAEWEYAARAGDEGGKDDYDRFRHGNWEAFKHIAWGRTAAYRMLTQTGHETFPNAEAFKDACNRKFMTHGTLTEQEERWLGEVLSPAAVGRLAPNHWGIYDMFGNGDETLLDRFDSRSGPGLIGRSLLQKGFRRDPLLICEAADARHVIVKDMGGILLDGDESRQTIRLAIGPTDFNGGRPSVGTSEARKPQTIKRTSALPGKTFKLPKKVTLDLIGCPAGTFQMGYPNVPAGHSEADVHEVKLTRPFWIGKHPVTREQWSLLMSKVGLDALDEALGGMKAPMTGVADSEIREFCQKLLRKFRGGVPKGYVFRLPTDAEWEYALRGGSDDPDDPHVGGNSAPEVVSLFAVLLSDKKARLAKAGIGENLIPKGLAWFIGPCEVCTKRPNGWGLYDMLGNVGERVLDTFPAENPDGSFKKHIAVLKGEITYQPTETDPLHMCEGDAAFGMIRGVADGRIPGLRRFYSQAAHERPVGFRVVLGPDLERETVERNRKGGRKGRK